MSGQAGADRAEIVTNGVGYELRLLREEGTRR